MSQALQLATIDRTRPKQASLRRSISTTYYAVFHLLTTAVASNWVNRDQRPAFERILEHGKMAKASARMAGQPFPNQNPIEVQHLRTVARTFSLLQGQRHSADYDGNQTWSRTDAVDANLLAGEAFRSWKAIRKTKIAQDYLLQFLVQR